MWLVWSVVDAIGVCLLLWVVKTWIVKGLITRQSALRLDKFAGQRFTAMPLRSRPAGMVVRRSQD